MRKFETAILFASIGAILGHLSAAFTLVAMVVLTVWALARIAYHEAVQTLREGNTRRTGIHAAADLWAKTPWGKTHAVPPERCYEGEVIEAEEVDLEESQEPEDRFPRVYASTTHTRG